MPVLDTFSLKGKVALVTGGAGLYGRQIGEALAEAGAKTFIASRGVEALEIVAQAQRERGYDITAMHLDLASDDSIEKLHADIIGEAGTCDILVNNAVHPGPRMTAGHMTWKPMTKACMSMPLRCSKSRICSRKI